MLQVISPVEHPAGWGVALTEIEAFLSHSAEANDLAATDALQESLTNTNEVPEKQVQTAV